jgi:hypothetical protein
MEKTRVRRSISWGIPANDENAGISQRQMRGSGGPDLAEDA